MKNEKETKAAEEEEQTPEEANYDSDGSSSSWIETLETIRCHIPRHNHTSSTGSKIPPTYKFTNASDATETTLTANDDSKDIDTIPYKEAQRLFQLPCAQELFEEFKDGVRQSAYEKLSELLDAEQTFEVRIEIADSIDLLRFLGASNPVLNEIAAGARQGWGLPNNQL